MRAVLLGVWVWAFWGAEVVCWCEVERMTGVLELVDGEREV